MYLGTGTMRMLALSVEAFRVPQGGKPPSEEFLVALQQHSLWSAGLAKVACGGESAEDAFMAGMLHDIGLLVMATMLPDELTTAIQTAEQEGRPLHEVEEEQRGSTHAEIGAYLLGLWGLPIPVVEAVAHHHLPSRVEHGEFELLTAVHAATALTALRAPTGHTGEAPPQPLDLAYLERMGVADRVSEWEEWLSDQIGGDVSS
jgi:HD-like signal output (HDOD) protein